MAVPTDAVISWNYPVLLHLRGQQADFGDWVVWLPWSEGESDEVWCGLGGVKSGRRADIAKRMSGVILLTAPERITEPPAALAGHTWPLYLSAGAISVAAALGW